ncbi:MAG: hypothetical protein LBE13_12925 [Bacteroidales bacterium]|jgi:hypothetical protein|nr:hypothetical protein [Bacteroidales bacterium]
MIDKKKFLKLGKFVFIFIVLICISVLFIRNYIERIEQKRSVTLRTGTDEDVQLISRKIGTQEISIIQNFTWEQLHVNKLFVSKYAYYCRCTSVAIILAVNKDQKAIPYLKTAIQKYIELPDISDVSLFDIYVWSLLYIEGKSAFIWLEKVFNYNLSFPMELKNRIITNARYILWIKEAEEDNDRQSISNFINDIQININIYDPDWIIRFYREYCRFYNISHFSNFDDWYKHFQQQKIIVSIPSYEEKMLFKSWYILISIMHNDLSTHTINISRNMLNESVIVDKF